MLDVRSRILDQCVAPLFLLIKRTEFLDPVSSIQYPISVCVIYIITNNRRNLPETDRYYENYYKGDNYSFVSFFIAATRSFSVAAGSTFRLTGSTTVP